MRIAHVTATFPPYYAGTGLVCYHNARELVRRGHEVHVFTAAVEGAPVSEVMEGILVHRLQPLLKVGNARLLPQLLSRLAGFDIYHLHYPFFGGEFTALAASRSRTPLIVTYHQDVILLGMMSLIEKVLRYTTSRATLRVAARVLFTTLDYAQASYTRPLLRGREGCIGELSNGVDIHVFTPGSAPGALRDRYGLTPDDKVVLLVAGLDVPHYFKGVKNLLGAMLALPDPYKAIIVGEGDMRPEYERFARQPGLEGRVHFPGRVAAADLPNYYRLSDVSVLPSLTMGEAFGMVLIEAMACGTPVIASNLPGVRTVVSDGVDGFLVQPGDVQDLADKLRRMLALSPAERQAMGAAGREKVAQRYTWELAGERLEAIYRQAVNRPPSERTDQ